MAATLAAAFDQVAAADLEQVAYSARPIHRAPEDRALARAFSGLEPDWQRRVARRLAARRLCNFDDAEEAIDQELLSLIEKQPEVFDLPPDRWLGMLFSRGWFRLLRSRAVPPPASTSALEEASGDVAFAGAGICAPNAPQAEEDGGSAPLPGPGEDWPRQMVISALQSFHRYYGRPPRARECSAVNRLPSYSTIRHHFGGLEAALMAAGLLPSEHGRRRRRWSQIEAAFVCRSFYRRHGWWPSASDAIRYPDELPNRSVMLRCFGSTHGGEIRAVAEAILAAAPCPPGRPTSGPIRPFRSPVRLL